MIEEQQRAWLEDVARWPAMIRCIGSAAALTLGEISWT